MRLFPRPQPFNLCSMAESTAYSESWYRIANQRISLRTQVHAKRQYFRGEKWFVLEDPFNNQYFRLRPEAYDFVARLRSNRTVQEVWDESLERHPDDAPGQEDVIRILAQLYHANLLHFDVAADSAKLFERYKKRKRKELTSKLLGIMFARFPLYDPDDLLKRILPFVKPFLGKIGAVIWILTILAAGKVAIENFDALKIRTDAVLAPGNLFLLYTGLVFIKTIHEIGHALVCRKFGGEVHVMGVMLLVFTPLPYVDATSSWSFRSRWERVYVAAAGMIFEVFVAACATFVWAYTAPGAIHSLAYNMIFIASVSTVLFNLNPLLRFDGYYILSDLLDMPNLHTRSKQQMVHMTEHYAFGCKKSTSPADTPTEATALAFFGVASGIYRIIVFAGIILFVADKFLLAGLIMAAICVFSWVLTPMTRLVRYLAASPKLERTRSRAVAVTVGVVVILILFLNHFPFPSHFRAPGVIEAIEHPFTVAEVSGYLAEITVPADQYVVHGQKLAIVENKELEFNIKNVQAQYREAQLSLSRSLNNNSVDLASTKSRIEAIGKQLHYLLAQKQALTITANQTGVWTAPKLDEYLGMWIPRGTAIGQIINESEFHFSATVSQEEASRLFDSKIQGAEVRLRGQAAHFLPVTAFQIIPAEQDILPSAALGWSGGGEVETDLADPSGLRTASTYFKVKASVLNGEDIAMFHGRSGKIRFDLPTEPLLHQWYRKLRQLLLKRYQI